MLAFSARVNGSSKANHPVLCTVKMLPHCLFKQLSIVCMSECIERFRLYDHIGKHSIGVYEWVTEWLCMSVTIEYVFLSVFELYDCDQYCMDLWQVNANVLNVFKLSISKENGSMCHFVCFFRILSLVYVCSKFWTTFFFIWNCICLLNFNIVIHQLQSSSKGKRVKDFCHLYKITTTFFASIAALLRLSVTVLQRMLMWKNTFGEDPPKREWKMFANFLFLNELFACILHKDIWFLY